MMRVCGALYWIGKGSHGLIVPQQVVSTIWLDHYVPFVKTNEFAQLRILLLKVIRKED